MSFFFAIGSFEDIKGRIVRGDINRFFGGDETAGILGGAYWFKMFGLPDYEEENAKLERDDRG